MAARDDRFTEYKSDVLTVSQRKFLTIQFFVRKNDSFIGSFVRNHPDYHTLLHFVIRDRESYVIVTCEMRLKRKGDDIVTKYYGKQ